MSLRVGVDLLPKGANLFDRFILTKRRFMRKYEYIAPGTRVGMFVLGVLRHEGIAADGQIMGEQTVISRSNRAGCAKEEPISVFAAGGEVLMLPALSDLHPTLVIANARRLIGTPWRFWGANCEHFVHESFGVEPKSPQQREWGGIAALTFLLVLLARSG